MFTSGVLGPKFHNAGSLLAILAGVLLLALTTWPMPSPEGGLGDATARWATASRALGAALVSAPFVLRWSVPVAKLILLVGAAGLIAIGAVSTITTGAMGLGFSVWVPAVMALAAALLIGPRQRPEVARAVAAQATAHRSDPPSQRRAA